MFTLVLIPCGSTEYDVQGRVLGTLNVPLSEDGVEQAGGFARCIEGVSLEAVYTAPCQSCEQTGEIVSRTLGLKPKTLNLLHNLDQGLWQGMLIQDVKEKQPKVYRKWQEQPEAVCPPDGETVEAARDRLRKVLKKLARKHKSGTIALVVPEPLGSVLRNLLLDEELGDLWDPCVGLEISPTPLVVPEEILAS